MVSMWEAVIVSDKRRTRAKFSAYSEVGKCEAVSFFHISRVYIKAIEEPYFLRPACYR